MFINQSLVLFASITIIVLSLIVLYLMKEVKVYKTDLNEILNLIEKIIPETIIVIENYIKNKNMYHQTSKQVEELNTTITKLQSESLKVWLLIQDYDETQIIKVYQNKPDKKTLQNTLSIYGYDSLTEAELDSLSGSYKVYSSNGVWYTLEKHEVFKNV